MPWRASLPLQAPCLNSTQGRTTQLRHTTPAPPPPCTATRTQTPLEVASPRNVPTWYASAVTCRSTWQSIQAETKPTGNAAHSPVAYASWSNLSGSIGGPSSLGALGDPRPARGFPPLESDASMILRFGDIPSKIARFWRDPQHRALVRARLLHRERLHQTTALTGMNRYPTIFSEASRQLRNLPHPRLLSFGCSTGEELLSLRMYFDSALIYGFEINAASLAIARSKPLDQFTKVLKSSPRALMRHAPYDAVFCMAVLQRTPHLIISNDIDDISQIYPFSKFDQQLVELDRLLSLGGLFVIEHTFYDLLDTRVAAHYQPVHFRHSQPPYPRFDKNGLRRVGTGEYHTIFRKISEGDA